MERGLLAKRMKVNIGEDKEKWDSFVKTSPQSSIFLHSNFLDSLSVKYELITCYQDGGIVCGLPIFFDSSGQIKDKPNKYMMYQGVLFSDKNNGQAHSKTTHNYKILSYFLEELANRYSRLSLTNSWKCFDMRPFQWLNYHTPEKGAYDIKLRYTGVINLNNYKNFEDYLVTVRRLRKRELNKAKDIVIEPTEEIDLFLDLHNITYKRQEIVLSEEDSRYRRSIVESGLKNKYGKMIKASTKEGAIVSMMFFLYDNHTAYYLFGANNPEARNSGASTALMLYFIKEAFKQGLDWFDFCGVNSPGRGDYKISFNVELKPYFITTYRS